MVLREFGVQGQLLRQLVPVAPENGLDVLQPVQTFPIGDAAAGIQALAGVLPSQVEQPETDPVGLLRVFPLSQSITDPDQRVWPDVPGPVLETPRGPLLLFSMPGKHMTGFGGGARPVTPWVTCHLALPEVDLHQMIAGLDFHLLAHVLVRYRVMMLVELDVVIDIDPATPDLDVLIGLFRQGTQGWLIQCLEGGLPVTREPPERAAVQLFKQ